MDKTNGLGGSWEPEIAAFEAADKTNTPPKDAVLLLGSSSIQHWEKADRQLSGHQIIKRGFGGSQLSDCVAYAERIVIPYQPKWILLYEGENDILAGKSPEQIRDDFKTFVAKVKTALPETRIVFLSIKPCPARTKYFAQQEAANQLVREVIDSDAQLTYVDVRTPTLSADGKPRAELYEKDGVHLNEKGYDIWARVIQSALKRLDGQNTAKI